MSFESVIAREQKGYPLFVFVVMIVAAVVGLVSLVMAAIYYTTNTGNSYSVKERVNDGKPYCYYTDPESTSEL